ncbi:MAG: hypothetical protein EOO05_17500 [Chitinophagaceae bacterium]|nr:MAG: hypothetical protein EOO05_17500 [Chitinophagaceae bacterium]
MKYLKFLLFIPFVQFTVGCSKSPEEPRRDGTLSMMIDGRLVEFTDQSFGTMENADDRNAFFFSAIDLPDSRFIAHFAIFPEHGEIKEGVYTLTPGSQSEFSMQLILDQDYNHDYNAGRGDNNPIKFTITSRTKDRIKGTFEATLTGVSGTLEITNGVFDYPYVYPKPI